MTPLSKVEGNANVESYQNYQNGAVKNQLTSLERGGREFVGVAVNLLMSNRMGALYSYTPQYMKPATPSNDKYKDDITDTSQ